MWTEKVFGLGESLLATTVETVRLQQKLLISTSEYWMAPWLLPQAMMETSFTHAPVAGERLLRKAMAPIHGKVVANAERLGRK